MTHYGIHPLPHPKRPAPLKQHQPVATNGQRNRSSQGNVSSAHQGEKLQESEHALMRWPCPFPSPPLHSPLRLLSFRSSAAGLVPSSSSFHFFLAASLFRLDKIVAICACVCVGMYVCERPPSLCARFRSSRPLSPLLLPSYIETSPPPQDHTPRHHPRPRGTAPFLSRSHRVTNTGKGRNSTKGVVRLPTHAKKGVRHQATAAMRHKGTLLRREDR